MNHTVSPSTPILTPSAALFTRIFTSFSGLTLHVMQRLCLRFTLLLLVLDRFSVSTAQNAAAFKNDLDKPATVLCGYMNVLPQSKWMVLIALGMAMLGVLLLATGQRGAMVWLGRAIVIVALVPAILGILKGLGIAC
ncbi:hypothetical protein [Deinococcus aquatilis]|uniref:hypothetical protein n=1 Tax=Deinococcus aquatilis TaxID=519440 RepID=UPI0003741E6D|nr:hypothetical protein [Deinococcus aquatilis]